ncbi:Bug family tripartite tricarboxylate transporter substrate binding protein [Roseococcus sp.]|uniref:Bug family tripartite tricarboxylate transporter substrate binding protein n=1 Tax=Roseococcus sp. TaxID=2109646 RepID=UPI003BA99FA0
MLRRHLALGLAAVPVLARAQTGFPQRPLTFLVPFSAGSGTDILARLVAPATAQALGQTAIIDNRGGAGGTIAVGMALRARPDGHTLVVSGTSTVPINRALYANLGYDPHRELAPVAVAVTAPNALVVRADGPIRDLEQLIAALRRRDRPTRYWSTGNGTSQHLSGVQLIRAAGGEAQHIPYRGPSEGLAGLLAGDTEWGFSALPAVVPLARDGRLKILAATGMQPVAGFAEVPNLAKIGMPGFAETDVFIGLSVQRAAPPEVLARLRQAYREGAAQPGMAERLAATGFTPAPPMSDAELEAFTDRQVAFWADLVRESGAKID